METAAPQPEPPRHLHPRPRPAETGPRRAETGPRPVETGPRSMERGPVGQRRFRDAMGLFPTGVTLLTTRAPDGADHGMTANSFTFVSLDPLLVLVCVEHASRLHPAVLESGLWAVSVLGEDAEQLSRRFARRGHRTADALAQVPHHRGRHTGALLLDEALATLEARTWAAHPGGDHTVLIGEVLALGTPSRETPPLVWYRGGYARLED